MAFYGLSGVPVVWEESSQAFEDKPVTVSVLVSHYKRDGRRGPFPPTLFRTGIWKSRRGRILKSRQ